MRAPQAAYKYFIFSFYNYVDYIVGHDIGYSSNRASSKLANCGARIN